MFVFFFSGCTLFLNKYLIDLTDGDATLLSKATTYNRYFIVSIFFDYLFRLFKLIRTYIIAIQVVEFSNGAYKIRKIFAKKSTYPKDIIEFKNWTQ